MSRGNQREIDRARAQARDAKKGGGEAREGNPESRRLADGGALQAKVEAKKKAAEEEAARKAAAEEFAKAAGQVAAPVEKVSAAAAPAPEVKKKKKKEEDLSFLDAAVKVKIK